MSHATQSTVNPITGLTEVANKHFGVPWVQQESVAKLRLEPHPNALHKVPVADGRLSLDFYAQLNPSDYLAVAFHGANSARAYSYPRFEWVKTFLPIAPAFLSFADPTLRVNREFELCWYAGDADYDPLEDLLRVIDAARNRVGARYVILMGSSGGGFPALRLAAHLDFALAFTQSTTTAVANSFGKTVDKYFRIAWPGRSKEDVLAQHSHRFDMVKLYAELRPSNGVYMLQNAHDELYRRRHYEPFKAVYLGERPTGVTADGRKHFIVEESANVSHGPPSPEEWARHWAQALRLMRTL